MKVALVYDRVNKWGGAERVLLALSELFPGAPLYTSLYHPQKAKWASKLRVKTTFLQKFPFIKSAHQYLGTLMPIAFENLNFDEFDVVISVTSEAAKGIITKPQTLHICYCLTPTRYLWSGYEEYFANPILRFLAKPFTSYLQTWDKLAAHRPDKYIAISKEVKRRIKKYYGRGSTVIYPPITLMANSLWQMEKNEKTIHNKPSAIGYLLIVSRLVPYKRIDLAIKACNRLNLPLKIIGTGSQEQYLKSIAGPSVEFLGYLTDEELLEYYKGSYGLIFPGKEDFGLTVLEVQSLGKPVLAYKSDGALETIVSGKTGMFFYPQTVSALEKSMKRFMKKKFDPKLCREQAARFSKEQFKQQFMAYIKGQTQ
ncbi:MAG TPA: glycosyltransferase [Candidatus Saccharimonadales bacterium]|nr:glycosyltransferase [Candidatus Saccharimonadales bacterium]